MVSLFDGYVKDNKEWMDRMINLLQATYGNIADINDMIERSKASENRKLQSQQALAGIVQLFAEFSDRLDLLNELVVEMRTTEEVLEARNKDLEVENATLKEKVKLMAETINKGNNLGIEVVSEDGMKRLAQQIEEVLELVESNAKVIAAAKNMKAGNITSNREIPGLDTKDIIEDYIANGRKITKEMRDKYSDEYGITYHGLMVRLQKAGVWKGRQR